MDRTSTEEPHLDRAPELGGRLRGIQSLPFTTVAGFVAAVVALILIAVLSYRSVQEWNRATERTSHTIAVLDAPRSEDHLRQGVTIRLCGAM